MAPQTAELETIFALSTAPGRAGIAVIRVSGSSAGNALKILTNKEKTPEPRRLVRAALRDPGDRAIIDRGLVAWFPGPGSATGENLAELHLHGGPAVVSGVLRALAGLPGLRLAEPGEFTRRAFDAGRLDLAEVEGLADLVAAETDAQRRQALALTEGTLSLAVAGWREILLADLAHLEAAIDFPDEGLPGSLVQTATGRATALRHEMSDMIEQGHRGARVRAGISIAIIGPPNAGKSSLLNRLADREAAIVAETAGTTRDIVEVQMDLGGYPVSLADTAGLREENENGQDSLSEIEREGIRRARERAASADMVLVLVEMGEQARIIEEFVTLGGGRSTLVVNKIDRRGDSDSRLIGDFGSNSKLERPVYYISAMTGEGIDELAVGVCEEVVRRFAVPQGAPVVARLRQREALTDCVRALERCASAPLPELAAEDLRLALRALDRLVGRSDVEDILDVIFRDFCIGK